jgi:hypothetical protein
MEISSVLSNPTDSASVMQKENKTTSSFVSHFLDASSNSTSAVSGTSSSNDPGGDEALQEFMSYAKETPAQRMFDNFLQSQNISKQQYDAMTPAQKQKLVDAFEAQLKEKLGTQLTGLMGAAVTL